MLHFREDRFMNLRLFRFACPVVFFLAVLHAVEVRGQDDDKVVKITTAEFIVATKNAKAALDVATGNSFNPGQSISFAARYSYTDAPAKVVLTHCLPILEK